MYKNILGSFHNLTLESNRQYWTCYGPPKFVHFSHIIANYVINLTYFEFFQLLRDNNNSFYIFVIHYFGQKRTDCVIMKPCINSTVDSCIPSPKSLSSCEALCIVGYGRRNSFKCWVKNIRKFSKSCNYNK